MVTEQIRTYKQAKVMKSDEKTGLTRLDKTNMWASFISSLLLTLYHI